MAAPRPQQSLADYVAVAISPVLIMALVGSLVFFLLEVLYVGQYSGRLQWALFFFVFGIVLIARISMQSGIAGRAGLYGLVLGGLVYLSLLRFADYHVGGALAGLEWAVNLALLALIWWCAHRLTWDCTYIDDNIDASGQGVLEAAGLDDTAPPESTPAADAEAEGTADRRALPANPLLAWYERYSRYREQQMRRPHTPGVWVVYFSLAALPLFGLGQALIPIEQTGRRRYAFWLLAIYVASGMGLLLTTSFLGLRRYLRQRKLTMPPAMAGVWLAVGGILILALLVGSAVLPRPSAEYQVVSFTPFGSRDREASRFAVQRDGAGQGKGQASSDPGRPDQKAESGSGNRRDPQQGGQAKGQSGGQKSGHASSGQGSRSQSGQQAGTSGAQGKQQGDSGAQGKQGQQSGAQRGQQAPNSQQDGSQQAQADRQQGQPASERKQASSTARGQDRASQAGNPQPAETEPQQAKDDSGSGQSTPPSNPVSSLLDKMSGLGKVLKWIVFGLLALVVLFFVLRAVLRFLANFTGWARSLLDALRAFWESLFGPRGEQAETAEADEAAPRRAPRPFRTYANPFASGAAQGMSPDELACYSFEALEAWAWEHDLARGPDETPLEFAERLGGELPALDAEARRLAGLYARVAYARGRLTPAALPPLREFWQRLDAVAAQSVSG